MDRLRGLDRSTNQTPLSLRLAFSPIIINQKLTTAPQRPPRRFFFFCLLA
jgi:hypothetical protein